MPNVFGCVLSIRQEWGHMAVSGTKIKFLKTGGVNNE